MDANKKREVINEHAGKIRDLLKEVKNHCDVIEQHDGFIHFAHIFDSISISGVGMEIKEIRG